MTRTRRFWVLIVSLAMASGCEVLRLNERGMILYSPVTQTSAMNLPPLESVILGQADFLQKWDGLRPSEGVTDPAWQTIHFLIFREDPKPATKDYRPGTNFHRLQQVNWTKTQIGLDQEAEALDTSPASGEPEARLADAIAALKKRLASDGTTHLILFSHGWQQDEERAELRYAEFINGMWRTLKLSPLWDAFVGDPGGTPRFKPLVVGVYWPSKGGFFSERDRAMLIGQTDLSQILWELIKYRHKSGNPFKIVLAGHSFGNRVINGAVEGRTDPGAAPSPYHFSKWDPAWEPLDAYFGFQPAMDIDVFHSRQCVHNDDRRLFCDVPARVRRMVLSFSAFDYGNRHAFRSDYMGYFGVDIGSAGESGEWQSDSRLKVFGSAALMKLPLWEQVRNVPVTVLSSGPGSGAIPIGLQQVDDSGSVLSHSWPFEHFLTHHRIIKLDLSRFVHHEGTYWTFTRLKQEVPEPRVDLANPGESVWKKLLQRLGSGAHTDIYYPEIWLLMWQILAQS